MMSLKTVSLLTLMVFGSCAQHVDRAERGIMNRIQNGKSTERMSAVDNARQAASSPFPSTSSTAGTTTENSVLESTTKVGALSWFLAPFTQRIQLSPQSFLQDRLVQLREALNKISTSVRDESLGKELRNAERLLQLVDTNDVGFYTNRLDSAGFLGGNGWLANKGGILGTPGALLSTGSLLTDYPTAYRKK